MAEMKEKAVAEPKHQFELLKSPIVAEFLAFRTEDSFAESDLESAILSHIRDFLMEMGKGFAFRGPAATYCDRYGRLLHRPCVLQHRTEMLCSD